MSTKGPDLRLDAPRTPLQQRLLTERGAWGWWSRGFQDGFQHGIEEGRRQADAELAAEMADAMDPATVGSWTARQLEARRARETAAARRAPGLTAEQIRQRALTSWGLA